MNQLHVDDVFSDALRAELIARVEKTAPTRTRKRTRLWAEIPAGDQVALGWLVVDLSRGRQGEIELGREM